MYNILRLWIYLRLEPNGYMTFTKPTLAKQQQRMMIMITTSWEKKYNHVGHMRIESVEGNVDRGAAAKTETVRIPFRENYTLHLTNQLLQSAMQSSSQGIKNRNRFGSN